MVFSRIRHKKELEFFIFKTEKEDALGRPFLFAIHLLLVKFRFLFLSSRTLTVLRTSSRHFSFTIQSLRHPLFDGDSVIRILPSDLINQIAAGEVIERPASVLKELVENALDAEATRIDVILQGGGQTLLMVRDNGTGMAPDDIELCLQRHATSKLPGRNLLDIHTFGFRGEALPSIGAIARLEICSRRSVDEVGARIFVEGGNVAVCEPTSREPGTTVTARDLFFATPARLKFLKAPRAEAVACVQQIKTIALAHPDVAFSLRSNGKEILNYAATEILETRFGNVLGADFVANSRIVAATEGSLSLSGRISIPTYHGREGGFLFVNQRPIKDRALAAALKVAYQNVLIPGEQPVYALFLTLPEQEVDVNVHPAKTEVRFRDLGRVKSFLIRILQKVLEQNSKTSSLLAPKLAEYARPEPSMASVLAFPQLAETGQTAVTSAMAVGASSFPSSQKRSVDEGIRTLDFSSWFEGIKHPVSVQPRPEKGSQPTFPAPPLHLGTARAQIFNSFILSETAEDVFLIDQHAAHERIIYEQLATYLTLDEKTGWILFMGPRQRLLFPAEILLNEDEALMAEDLAEILDRIGFGSCLVGKTLQITTCPQLLAHEGTLEELIRSLLREITTTSESSLLFEKVHHLLATMACHNSIRANHPLSDAEQDALLRQIETTPRSSQCNHGRPSFIRLSRNDIERLFERK